MAPLVLAPEIASYDCGSVNFGERVFINSPTFLGELATRMQRYGVKPEIECFEPGHIWNALRLIDDGLLAPPFWFQFVLGVRGGSPPDVKQLQHMVEMLPAGAHWSVCGIGRAQLPLGMAAMAMGANKTGTVTNASGKNFMSRYLRPFSISCRCSSYRPTARDSWTLVQYSSQRSFPLFPAHGAFEGRSKRLDE